MFLNNHSFYSLRYGTISPSQLVEQGIALCLKEMVLTDINNTSAGLDFAQLAYKNHIKPILGIDFRNGAQQQFIGLAINNEGWFQLNEYLSDFLHTDDYKIPKRAKKLPHTYVIYPFQKEIFELDEHEYIGVKPSDLNQLKFSKWLIIPIN